MEEEMNKESWNFALFVKKINKKHEKREKTRTQKILWQKVLCEGTEKKKN